MTQNILKLLVKAIQERHCIAIRYRGQRAIRIIEPHAVYTSEHGEVTVDGYQTRGYSESGRMPPFWRPFRLRKITAISMLKEPFFPRVTEGFSTDKLKYQSGLVAIVENPAHDYMYSPEALKELGPFLPGKAPGSHL